MAIELMILIIVVTMVLTIININWTSFKYITIHCNYHFQALQMEMYQIKPVLGSLQQAGSGLIHKNADDDVIVDDLTNKVMENEYQQTSTKGGNFP